VAHRREPDFVAHDELEVDRRGAKARELNDHQGAALGAAPGLGSHALIDLTIAAAMIQPKARLGGRIGRRGILPRLPAGSDAAFARRRGSGVLSALPAASVHHDVDPWRTRKTPVEGRIGVGLAHGDHHHPAGAGRTDARSWLGVWNALAAETLASSLPEEDAEIVPGIVPNPRVRVRLQAAVAVDGSGRSRLDAIRRACEGQGAALKPLDDALFTDPLRAHTRPTLPRPAAERQPAQGDRSIVVSIDLMVRSLSVISPTAAVLFHRDSCSGAVLAVLPIPGIPHANCLKALHGPVQDTVAFLRQTRRK
jgi:hypothetical protein